MTQKIKTKLTNFTTANKRLREAVTAYKNDSKNELYRDALIQRFEFTFELAWKSLAEVLKDAGIVLEILSPKSVFKAAYSAGYVNDEIVWVNILDDRNLTSHVYDEETANRIAGDICNRYAKAIGNLLKSLSE